MNCKERKYPVPTQKPFDPKEFLRRHGFDRRISLSTRVAEERVILEIELSPSAMAREIDEQAMLKAEGPQALCEFAEEVRLTIEIAGAARKRRSAIFSTRQVVAILGGRWPDHENIDRIRRSIEDKKAYPMPEFEPPTEKSLGAQGQTKKPGSHSQSRHS